MLALKAFTGAGWLVGSRFVGRLIDFFTLLVMARALTPADFGLVALAMALVAIIDMVLEVPVTQALVRLNQIDESHLDTGFTLAVLRGVVVAVVVIAAAWPFSQINNDSHLIPVVLALAIAPIMRGLASPGLIHFIRDLGFRRIFHLEITGKIVAFCLAMAALFLGGSYWALVVNFVASPVAAGIGSYLLAPYRPKFSLSRWADFAGFAGWFTGSQLVSAINWQFDRILLGALASKEVLGRYSVANDLSVIPTQSLIGPALQPIMAAFSRIHGDDERLRSAFLKAARFSMLISIPCCLGIALTADLLVAILLGAKWQAAADFLRLLSLSVAATPYLQTLYSLALAIGRPEFIFRLNLFDLVVRSFLVVLGFSYGGAPGVAEGRLLAAGLMAVAVVIQTRRLISIGIVKQLLNLWKVGAAGAAMCVGVVALRAELAGKVSAIPELALIAVTGAVLYGGGLACSGLWLLIGPGRLELVDRWWRH
ncbi:lipopolysaccharide biosynthesis protein [Bosea sp. 2YAB26]|uniref:lipopolysaccharide biosynthesis protein n=1 Tax=Bosea sp. 2YAB26 TaxID=3237478 RepID=UPI003F8E5E5C